MEHSTTHPRIPAISRPAVIHPSITKKRVFVVSLAFFGVCSILAGIVSLVSAIILLSNATSQELANSMLIETVYGFGLGALILFSSKAFSQGKLLSIWLYGSSILVDCLYHVLLGYPLNYLFVGFGLLLIWQILKFRDELELA